MGGQCSSQRDSFVLQKTRGNKELLYVSEILKLVHSDCGRDTVVRYLRGNIRQKRSLLIGYGPGRNKN